MSEHNAEGPIIVRNPRPWWHVVVGTVVGLGVIGGAGAGYLYVAHRTPLTRQSAVVGHHKTLKAGKHPQSAAPNTSTPPNYVTPPTAQTGQLFQEIAGINTHYIAWGDQQISHAVPAIPASGSGAGTLTPAILNAPSTLARWPGPKVPSSLQAVGVHLPPGTPANGSIVGLTAQGVATALKANKSWWPNLTTSELMGAYETAAKFVMANEGNDPASGLQYMDPYAAGGNLDEQSLTSWGPKAVASDFVASAGKGGMLPLRQVNYESWASFNLNPSNYYVDGTTLALANPPTRSPKGHVAVSGVDIVGIQLHVIGTGMVNGKLIIGQFNAQIGNVTLALLHDGGQIRWYVTAMNGVNFSNTPNLIYWTAP